jgi:hypothetical protein
MSLRTDAFELLATLNQVIESLRRFQHPNGAPYATDMAAQLEPVVVDFEHAIVESRSNDAAVAALDAIGPLMHNLNGAATKGDLRIFPAYDDQTLDTYWRLNTIFRESKYASETL